MATTDLTGELVRLRAPQMEDAQRMTELLQDASVTQHLDHWALPPYTIDKALGWITTDSPAAIEWAIECRSDGAYIGNTGLNRIDELNRRCSWGIWIGPPERWGHGYGTEACRLAVRYAFSELRLEKVTLEVYAGNERARRAYLRAGFVSEGVRRRHHWNGSELVDVEEMAVFADSPLYAGS